MKRNKTKSNEIRQTEKTSNKMKLKNVTGLFPEIRRKLEAVLVRWDAFDTTAYVILSPWKNVFDSRSMEALLSKCIAPKLVAGLRGSLVINPANQVLYVQYNSRVKVPIISLRYSTAHPFSESDPVESIFGARDNFFLFSTATGAPGLKTASVE